MTKQSEAQLKKQRKLKQRIHDLFDELDKKEKHPFPKSSNPKAKDADKHGVYVLRDPNEVVVHVGRTYFGKGGINQRLGNHLSATSSFTKVYLKRKKDRLRKGYTYQYLVVPNDRERALLEYLATVNHCPLHLGVHTAKTKTLKQRPTLKKT